MTATTAQNPILDESQAVAELSELVVDLEFDLLELPCVQETAVLHVDLPGTGDALVVAFVPVSPDREVSGQRAAQAACARRLPQLPTHVMAVDAIPRTLDGDIRSRELLDSLIPQLARDLIAQGNPAV